jgi:hypothetical protein
MSHLRFAAIWLLCLLAASVSLIWLAAGILKPTSRRAWRIAIGFDQLANATFGGDEDETISSRCWRYREEQPYRALRKLVDTAFALAGESDHCENAFRSELSKRRST